MGVYEVPDVEIGETIGVVEHVGMTVNVFKLGVWRGTGTVSTLVLSDIEVVGDALSGHWSR